MNSMRLLMLVAVSLLLSACIVSPAPAVSTTMPLSTQTPVPPRVTVVVLTPMPDFSVVALCVETWNASLNLNVREGPGVEFPAVASLPNGAQVVVIVPPRFGWYKLLEPASVSGGWVNGEYLLPCQ